MIILATYSFTDWIRVLSGMAPMGIVFTITTYRHNPDGKGGDAEGEILDSDEYSARVL